MKCLGETAKEVASRLRQLAGGVAEPADAEAIEQYADWLEAHPDDEEFKDLLSNAIEDVEKSPGGRSETGMPQ